MPAKPNVKPLQRAQDWERKYEKGKCIILKCRNDAQNGKRVCFKHHQELYKLRHPYKYKYNMVRSNAKRRGQPFNITFDYFKNLAKAAGYGEQFTGAESDSMSINRKDESKGYVKGNIEFITVSENARRRGQDISEIIK